MDNNMEDSYEGYVDPLSASPYDTYDGHDIDHDDMSLTQPKRRKLSNDERLLKNRERNKSHARKTRERKKNHMIAFKARIRQLEEESESLRSRVDARYTASVLLGMGTGIGGSSNSSTSSGLTSHDSGSGSGSGSGSTSVSGHDHSSDIKMEVEGVSTNTTITTSSNNSESNLDMKTETEEHTPPSSPTSTKNAAEVRSSRDICGSPPKDMYSEGGAFQLALQEHQIADTQRRVRRRGKYTPQERELIRRERNRIHAKKTRDKKKIFLEASEKAIERLETDVKLLRDYLKAVNMITTEELQQLLDRDLLAHDELAALKDPSGNARIRSNTLLSDAGTDIPSTIFHSFTPRGTRASQPMSMGSMGSMTSLISPIGGLGLHTSSTNTNTSTSTSTTNTTNGLDSNPHYDRNNTSSSGMKALVSSMGIPDSSDEMEAMGGNASNDDIDGEGEVDGEREYGSSAEEGNEGGERGSASTRARTRGRARGRARVRGRDTRDSMETEGEIEEIEGREFGEDWDTGSAISSAISIYSGSGSGSGSGSACSTLIRTVSSQSLPLDQTSNSLSNSTPNTMSNSDSNSNINLLTTRTRTRAGGRGSGGSGTASLSSLEYNGTSTSTNTSNVSVLEPITQRKSITKNNKHSSNNSITSSNSNIFTLIDLDHIQGTSHVTMLSSTGLDMNPQTQHVDYSTSLIESSNSSSINGNSGNSSISTSGSSASLDLLCKATTDTSSASNISTVSLSSTYSTMTSNLARKALEKKKSQHVNNVNNVNNTNVHIGMGMFSRIQQSRSNENLECLQ